MMVSAGFIVPLVQNGSLFLSVALLSSALTLFDAVSEKKDA